MNIDNILQSAFEYFQEGRLEQAEFACKEVLDLQPDNSDALHLLGIIYHHKGENEVAVEYINKSIELRTDNAFAYYNLGTVYRENGQIDEAIDSFRKSVGIDPSNAAAFNNLGIALKEKGLFDEAISCYRKAVELNPELVPAYYNIGTIYQQMGRLDEAASFYRNALELDGNNAVIHHSLGVVIKEKGLFDEAVYHFKKAVEYDPDNAAFYIDLGIALKDMEQLDEAIFALEKSFQLEPNDTALDRIYDIAELILQKGNLKEGWDLYWKFNDSYWHKHIPNKPMWNGNDMHGLTVVLQSDAGFGDALQYIRYAPLVANKGAKVILNCNKELISLLESVRGVYKVVPVIRRSEFDIFIPIRRLPFVFGTTLETIPAAVPYIKADLELVRKWEGKFRTEGINKLKVGLTWAAGHGDRNRSCPFSLFAPLAEIQNIIFYSLQVGEDAWEAGSSEGLNLVDYTLEIKDFSDTAAIIENLDLTISVDTAVAHVAGALGKPVWTLLPYIADSRWLLDREDSPWYPTMRLFRQPSPGDWKSVVNRVFDDLFHQKYLKIADGH